MTVNDFISEWNNDNSPYISVHTSGSTGKPKAMSVEKEKMINSARVTCDFLGLKKRRYGFVMSAIGLYCRQDDGSACIGS